MKLLLEGTGREVRILPSPADRKVYGTLWQGETIGGVPVMAMIVVLTPLIAADDPRQAQFETDYLRVMDAPDLNPAVEIFPDEVEL